MGALALFLPILLKEAPGWIRGIEAALAGKPKSGVSDKMPLLKDLARAFITKLLAIGVLPDGTAVPHGATVGDEELTGALEAIFQHLKNSGQLVTAEADSFFFIRGKGVTMAPVAWQALTATPVVVK